MGPSARPVAGRTLRGSPAGIPPTGAPPATASGAFGWLDGNHAQCGHLPRPGRGVVIGLVVILNRVRFTFVLGLAGRLVFALIGAVVDLTGIGKTITSARGARVTRILVIILAFLRVVGLSGIPPRVLL